MKRHAKSLVELLEQELGLSRVRTGAEVGVWRGELSQDLLLHFPFLTLHMVDAWENIKQVTMSKDLAEVTRARLETMQRMERFLERHSIWWLSSVEAAEHILKQGIWLDFVFIDACHQYESVRDDIKFWRPLVRPNGILAGHDYNGVGDRRHGWGVKKAVDEAFKSEVRVLPGNVWWVRRRTQ